MAEYSVLIPIVNMEPGEMLLMEVRSEYVKQPGEVCFPGGRIEEGETPSETAIRETCEELGISKDDIHVTNEPHLEIMGDGRRVWSVPARIDTDALQGLTPSGAEVAEVFLLPIKWLRENPPEYYDMSELRTAQIPEKLLKYLSHYPVTTRAGEKTYYWEFDEHGIWGLTAKVIKRYLNLQ